MLAPRPVSPLPQDAGTLRSDAARIFQKGFKIKIKKPKTEVIISFHALDYFSHTFKKKNTCSTQQRVTKKRDRIQCMKCGSLISERHKVKRSHVCSHGCCCKAYLRNREHLNVLLWF